MKQKKNIGQCKKCGNDFDIPLFTFDVAFAFYCKPCIKKALKKYTSLSINDAMKLHAKQIFNIK